MCTLQTEPAYVLCKPMTATLALMRPRGGGHMPISCLAPRLLSWGYIGDPGPTLLLDDRRVSLGSKRRRRGSLRLEAKVRWRFHVTVGSTASPPCESRWAATTDTTVWVVWTTTIYFSLFWPLGHPRSRCLRIQSPASGFAEGCLLAASTQGGPDHHAHVSLQEHKSHLEGSTLTMQWPPQGLGAKYHCTGD